mmetsp:Transcript_18485/g.37520  ORF Transcript_18485/g.37520 Transcript_18485/m.37520 type:complete len:208 (+) Transcript_18485:281-904(+)
MGAALALLKERIAERRERLVADEEKLKKQEKETRRKKDEAAALQHSLSQLPTVMRMQPADSLQRRHPSTPACSRTLSQGNRMTGDTCARRTVSAFLFALRTTSGTCQCSLHQPAQPVYALFGKTLRCPNQLTHSIFLLRTIVNPLATLLPHQPRLRGLRQTSRQPTRPGATPAHQRRMLSSTATRISTLRTRGTEQLCASIDVLFVT